MQRVITGWAEYVRLDGTTEVVEQDFFVEDLAAEHAMTEVQELLLSAMEVAPTLVYTAVFDEP